MDTNDPIAIRHATLNDISQILRLERSSNGAAHWSEAQYQSLIAAQDADVPTLALIAEYKASPALVGFLIARHVALEWELENMVVAAEARGKGIGTQLMEELLDRAQQAKSQSVFLEVRESNVAAISLYRKFGFRQTGRRKSYYSNPIEDALLFTRTLD